MPPNPVRYAAGQGVYATVVDPESDAFAELQRFQEQSFARVQSSRDSSAPSYVEATHTAPSRTVPIMIRRTGSDGTDELIGVSRLELTGATLVESMIALREDSQSARTLAAGKVAEIASFAATTEVERSQLVDMLNALAGVIIQIAEQEGVEWFWIFPRSAFMSLVRAEIPDLLPPYHFMLSPDASGWIEDSPQLAALRAMRLRGFMDTPLFYQITVADLADDLRTRMALDDKRAQLGATIETQLKRAMVTAERTLRQEARFLYPDAYARTRDTNGARSGSDDSSTILRDPSASSSGGHVRFLPNEMTSDLSQANYLRQVLSSGGSGAHAYKALSYSLLDIQPGMRVLDVGCGAGVDLRALSALAGPRGGVVGLEVNPDLVREARKLAMQPQNSSSATIFVLQGDAHRMTVPSAEFDRVRTDRALQHFPDPRRALNEMWRVLKPGGILTLAEPDWGAMVVSPGSDTTNGDDSVNEVFAWCRRRLANPLIGRQLHELLRDAPEGSWESTKVVVAPFTLSQWEEMDAVLLLSRAAMALSEEQPDRADELTAWLDRVQRASDQQRFFGYIPIFYGVAVKAA